ncbi:MAG TPA: helix-hairpin-helix domain-containing protein [Parafilimonas sp.]|nr:helix-hairpin-helix domain-containing protein [Parafilimonas sp.]
MYKNSWKEWFLFTRRDRNAATMLLLIIGLLIVLPYLVPAKRSDIHIDKALQEELDQYLLEHPRASEQAVHITANDTAVNDTVKHELFFFDPNTLSEDGFIQLGLSQKVIHTLINYRNKGGYFKTPEDIRKIYGLSKTDADRLIPYVRITPVNTRPKKDDNMPVQANATTPSKAYQKININTATAEDWKAFPGIGEVLANRIIKFRTSMNGFKNVNQVGKTYGLSDSVFQTIKPYLYIEDSARTTQ